jgi:hypothetical protein
MIAGIKEGLSNRISAEKTNSPPIAGNRIRTLIRSSA